MKIVADLNNSYLTSDMITLTQGDTKPYLTINMVDEIVHANGTNTIIPLDVSNSTVCMKLRKTGTANLIDTIICTAIPGLENSSGSVEFDAPYDQPGVGGRVLVAWNTNSLSVAGVIEGEVEVTFIDESIQTAFNVIKMYVRPQF